VELNRAGYGTTASRMPDVCFRFRCVSADSAKGRGPTMPRFDDTERLPVGSRDDAKVIG
jgi:hypothetical protein